MKLRILARSSKWLFSYRVASDIGNWPLKLDNIDRVDFAKWCQFYTRLFENYDDDERPDDRMMHYDVLVDNFIKEEHLRRKKRKNKNDIDSDRDGKPVKIKRSGDKEVMTFGRQ